ncbi:MAG: histidine kinase [Novosphingobium sp.]|jgi:hypothetical protein|nr:histidine kinase [Novosphingobium sp.]
MRRNGLPIQSLLLRTFLPAVIAAAMLLATMVYTWLSGTIVDGFDRKLVTTSALAGALVDPADHAALVRAWHAGGDPLVLEQGEAYRRNVVPMQQIRQKLGLTYLYSQILGGPQDIEYILDSSFGDDHSNVGYADALPAETMAGLRHSQKTGGVYVSPIEYQEKWGLLKTAAAPLYAPDGRIAGTAGADVNISVIRVATQNALFASAMIGIGSVLACLVVALALVRLIGGPITRLKQEALRIAAGDFAEPARIRGPREVARLRDALAAIAARMTARAAQRRDTAERHERAADAALLGQALAADAAPFALLAHDAVRSVAWLAGDARDPAVGLAMLAMAELGRTIARDPALAARWRDLADLDHGACLIRDHAAGTLECVGATSAEVRVNGTPVALVAGHPAPLPATAHVEAAFGDRRFTLPPADRP